MASRTNPPGLRSLQWTVTLVVAIVWVLVIIRVSDCIGDAECTFAPRAIENAILAFVGGPLALLAVWVVPLSERRRSPGWTAARWMGIGSVGAAALIVGVLLAGAQTLADWGAVVVIILLTIGPALLLGGVAGLIIRVAAEDADAL